MKTLPTRQENRDDVAPAVVLVPSRAPIDGTLVRLEPLDPQHHGEGLYRAGHEGADTQAVWEYLPYGPFADAADYGRWLNGAAGSLDPIFYAVRDLGQNRLAGLLSFLTIAPHNASIEIGHIWFAPFLQRTPAATEALFLVMRQAFDDLGYRRSRMEVQRAQRQIQGGGLAAGFCL